MLSLRSMVLSDALNSNVIIYLVVIVSINSTPRLKNLSDLAQSENSLVKSF